MSDTPTRICATCLRGLNVRMGLSGVSWEHPLGDGDLGHEVVPIPPPPGWTGRCHFCSAPRPPYIVPARDFILPGDLDQASGGDWAACTTCAALVDQSAWPELEARIAEQFEHRNGWPLDRAARRHLTKLYTRLNRNITGPARPIIQEDT